jgi:hypothetical protein
MIIKYLEGYNGWEWNMMQCFMSWNSIVFGGEGEAGKVG